MNSARRTAGDVEQAKLQQAEQRVQILLSDNEEASPGQHPSRIMSKWTLRSSYGSLRNASESGAEPFYRATALSEHSRGRSHAVWRIDRR